jgi:hypothetical protein
MTPLILYPRVVSLLQFIYVPIQVSDVIILFLHVVVSHYLVHHSIPWSAMKILLSCMWVLWCCLLSFQHSAVILPIYTYSILFILFQGPGTKILGNFLCHAKQCHSKPFFHFKVIEEVRRCKMPQLSMYICWPTSSTLLPSCSMVPCVGVRAAVASLSYCVM